MFKNVLVGVDGRPGGRDAIALARLLGDPGAKLTLVFVRSTDIAEDVAESEELLERERSAAGLEAELLSVDRAQSRPRPSRTSRAAGSRSARGRLLQPRQLRSRDAEQRHARRPQRRPLRGRGSRARLRRAPQSDLQCRCRLQRIAREQRQRSRWLRSSRRRPKASGSRAGSRLAAIRHLRRPRCTRDRGLRRRGVKAGERTHERACRRRRTRGVWPRRRGARQVRRRAGHPRGRLARLRPAATSRQRQHLQLPGAPRALLAARAAPHGHRPSLRPDGRRRAP